MSFNNYNLPESFLQRTHKSTYEELAEDILHRARGGHNAETRGKYFAERAQAILQTTYGGYNLEARRKQFYGDLAETVIRDLQGDEDAVLAIAETMVLRSLGERPGSLQGGAAQVLLQRLRGGPDEESVRAKFYWDMAEGILRRVHGNAGVSEMEEKEFFGELAEAVLMRVGGWSFVPVRG